MTEVEKLISARKKAEEAVSNMPEGELKTKAFETILTHLLSSRDVSVKNANRKAPASSSKSMKTTAEGNATPKETTEISSTDLAELKEEIQKIDKITSWEGALLIADIYEKSGQSTFTSKDLERIYRALVRGGTSKLPIVKDYKTLTQDMVRYKFWFDRARRGEFRLSDAGVRALQELRKNEGINKR